MLRLFRMNKEYGGSWVTGVPPGLQNQCGALGASRVGSIPTCPRQRKLSEYYEKGFSNTSIYNIRRFVCEAHFYKNIRRGMS